MKKCWESDPEDRPTFSELVNSIEAHADFLTGYVDMSELSPCPMTAMTVRVELEQDYTT